MRTRGGRPHRGGRRWIRRCGTGSAAQEMGSQVHGDRQTGLFASQHSQQQSSSQRR